MGSINFFSADITFNPKGKKKIRLWIQDVLKKEKTDNYDFINIIFCSDSFLMDINRRFLNHDYYTDIITFKDAGTDNHFEGELYISIDRIKENCQKLRVSFQKELYRVIIHGILHLCGYKDKRKKEKQLMRSSENRYLQNVEF